MTILALQVASAVGKVAEQSSEPVAIYILGAVLIAALLVLGYFIKGILDSIKKMADTLNKILQTLAQQEEKNKNFDFLWKEVHDLKEAQALLEKVVIELKNICALCSHNPFKNKN